MELGNLYKNIYLTEQYQCTYSTNSTNEIIVPERPDLSWSQKSYGSTAMPHTLKYNSKIDLGIFATGTN